MKILPFISRKYAVSYWFHRSIFSNTESTEHINNLQGTGQEPYKWLSIQGKVVFWIKIRHFALNFPFEIYFIRAYMFAIKLHLKCVLNGREVIICASTVDVEFNLFSLQQFLYFCGMWFTSLNAIKNLNLSRKSFDDCNLGHAN